MDSANGAEQVESGGSAMEERSSLNFFNKCSGIQHIEDKDTYVYNFDYKNTKDKENVDWQVLQDLKRNNKWKVMKHPMVLNFINERLLDCAPVYTLHILAYALFLLFLSSHIFSRSMSIDWIITAFLFIFVFFMVFKVAVKVRVPGNQVSFWFVVGCVFNFLTYVATFCYVWLPTVFAYDDYHQEVKNVILWFLPIVAIVSAWLNFLYILRKSPCGIYVFMMARILRSFGHISIIWIPTLIAFTAAFHLIMRDSKVVPWDYEDGNATMVTNTTVVLFDILQAMTKTTAMMIGEIDANDILRTRQWIASILVLVFEITTVIILMNLMVSLAVGDVSDLRNAAQDMLLKIKITFVIEALQLSEIYSFPGITPLHKRRTNNILVVDSDGGYCTLSKKTDQLLETTDSIQSLAKDHLLRRYCKWIIGLDWTGYLEGHRNMECSSVPASTTIAPTRSTPTESLH